jgi:hypothetical protein
MRIVLVAPSPIYTTLDECKFKCTCGEEAEYRAERIDGFSSVLAGDLGRVVGLRRLTRDHDAEFFLDCGGNGRRCVVARERGHDGGALFVVKLSSAGIGQVRVKRASGGIRRRRRTIPHPDRFICRVPD